MADLASLAQALDICRHAAAFLLGMPRLFILVLMAPFFGSAVVTGQIRLVLVLALYLPLHPKFLAELEPAICLSPAPTFSMGLHLLLLLCKECLLGLLLGFLAGLVFWMIQSTGFFIDNQRGAGMSEEADILSGEQSSPLGRMLLQSLICLFYASGAFLAFLDVVYASYELWPLQRILPAGGPAIPLYFADKINWLLGRMLLLSGPIAAACLLADISLGLVNRFVSQLNVYVLAMPIKSGLTAFLLCFYFGILLAHAPELFGFIRESIFTLAAMWGAKT